MDVWFIPSEELSVMMMKDGLVWFRGSSLNWPSPENRSVYGTAFDTWWPVSRRLAFEIYGVLPDVLEAMRSPVDRIGPCKLVLPKEAVLIEIESDVRIRGDFPVKIHASAQWLSYMWRTFKGLHGGYRDSEPTLKEGVLVGWPNEEDFLTGQLRDFDANYEQNKGLIHSGP